MHTTTLNPAGVRRYDHADVTNTAEYKRLAHAFGDYLKAARIHPTVSASRFFAVAAEMGMGVEITDSCPECIDYPTVPFRIDISDNGATGRYRCRVCDNTWQCSWSLSTLGPPIDARIA